MITHDLRRITRAKELQDSAKEVEKLVKETLSPRLNDVGLLRDIYRHFKDFVDGVKTKRHTEGRREFLFIVAYLYCPSVLVGGTMPKGFRGLLKDILHVESPSAISNYTSDLLFIYEHYRDFRELVEGAFTYIADKMNLYSLMYLSVESEKRD